MHLADWFYCPRCKGRLDSIMADSLSGTPAGSLFCTNCEAIVPAPGGIPDFVGERAGADVGPHAVTGDPFISEEASAGLLKRIATASEAWWPASLGDVLELGCGGGRITRALAHALKGSVRGVLAVDTAMDSLRACRDGVDSGVDSRGEAEAAPVAFARLSLQEDVLRDAVADTVISLNALSRVGDVRALLTMIHRVLKPGGAAFFLAPNQRFMQAFCHGLSAALVHRSVQAGGWSAESQQAVTMVSAVRQRCVHQGDTNYLASLRDKHLFVPEALEDLAREIGFAGAHLRPLEFDPLGGETTRRLCLEAGIDETFARDLAPLVVSVGTPYFSLLSRQDASDSMSLWVTKGIGPSLRTFTAPPRPAAVTFTRPEAALGGAPPRWSIEVAAQETPRGILLTADGWCLVNTDVVWVRFRINGIPRDVPVFGPRTDVHDVMNGRGLYHPVNAVCSGLRASVLFDGAHPQDNQCALLTEVVLANGVIVQAAAPKTLVMNEIVTIAQ